MTGAFLFVNIVDHLNPLSQRVFEGAVVEWSKALVLREKTNNKQ